MDMNNARLADFTNGWHRHPDDEGIVFTSQIDIFRTAANDASCRAAILEVSEEKRVRDRLLIADAWKNTPENNGAMVGFDYTRTAGASYEMPEELEPALSIVDEMANILYDIKGQTRSRVSIIGNWRVAHHAEHKPHDFEVLNRVFGKHTQGTVLPINTGHIQVTEANFLAMKVQCPHSPELENDNNANIDRQTIAMR